MESKYKFETEHFGVTEDSIKLLRNRFNYKSIEFSEINSISIEKGKDLKNWYWVLIIGLGLLTFAVYDSITIYRFFSSDEGGVIYIERLLIPFFPLLIGVYSVIISFRNAFVMKMQVKNKKYYFSLKDLTKQGKYDEFLNHIQTIYPMTKIVE